MKRFYLEVDERLLMHVKGQMGIGNEENTLTYFLILALSCAGTFHTLLEALRAKSLIKVTKVETINMEDTRN